MGKPFLGLNDLDVEKIQSGFKKKEPITSTQIRKSVKKRMDRYAFEHEEKNVNIVSDAVSEYLDKLEAHDKSENERNA